MHSWNLNLTRSPHTVFVLIHHRNTSASDLGSQLANLQISPNFLPWYDRRTNSNVASAKHSPRLKSPHWILATNTLASRKSALVSTVPWFVPPIVTKRICIWLSKGVVWTPIVNTSWLSCVNSKSWRLDIPILFAYEKSLFGVMKYGWPWIFNDAPSLLCSANVAFRRNMPFISLVKHSRLCNISTPKDSFIGISSAKIYSWAGMVKSN